MSRLLRKPTKDGVDSYLTSDGDASKAALDGTGSAHDIDLGTLPNSLGAVELRIPKAGREIA